MPTAPEQPQPQLGAVQGGTFPLQRVGIYSCQRWLYLVGLCRLSRRYSVLRLSREFHGAQLQAVEEPGRLTQSEVNVLLRSIHETQTRAGGGLKLVVQAHGIIGCFRLTDSYYIMLITRKSCVGTICGHKIYKIDAVALLPLAAAGGGGAAGPLQYEAASEKRYRKLLMGVDLSKNFYFSYTYTLADTLQANCCPHPQPAASAPAGQDSASGSGGPSASAPPSLGTTGWGQRPGVFDSMFVWNSHLTCALRAAVGHDDWVVPIIHGFWHQCQVSVFGRTLTLTLVARRSRHFAGTRYRKRGITDTGKVANEVEVEQIVDAGRDWSTGLPLLSSLVQLRGSVPLFWGQATSALSPKPQIVLQQFDPLYEVTALHFADLRRRYGPTLVVLNLLRSRERVPRETLLRRGLAQAVGVLNAQAPTVGERTIYIPFDFRKHAKHSGSNMLQEMSGITNLVLNVTGSFLHRPRRSPAQPPRPGAHYPAPLTPVGSCSSSPRAGAAPSRPGRPRATAPGLWGTCPTNGRGGRTRIRWRLQQRQPGWRQRRRRRPLRWRLRRSACRAV